MRFCALRFQVDTHKNKEHLQIPIVEPVRANAGAAALLLCVFAGVSLWCDLAHKSIAGEPERAPGAWCVRPCFNRTWCEIDRCTFGPARFQQIRPNFFFFLFTHVITQSHSSPSSLKHSPYPPSCTVFIGPLKTQLIYHPHPPTIPHIYLIFAHKF